MRAKQKRVKLTEPGLRRLLQKSMKNYRDLTAAINGMWDKLQPRLLPVAGEMTLHSANARPVRFVERMTTAIIQTLDSYEYERRMHMKAPRPGGGGRGEIRTNFSSSDT
jgi:hypothetical protein